MKYININRKRHFFVKIILFENKQITFPIYTFIIKSMAQSNYFSSIKNMCKNTKTVQWSLSKAGTIDEQIADNLMEMSTLYYICFREIQL